MLLRGRGRALSASDDEQDALRESVRSWRTGDVERETERETGRETDRIDDAADDGDVAALRGTSACGA